MESLIKYKEEHIYILQENQSLKDRIEKAIEEIYYLISNCDLTVYQGEKLKQILKGSDK